MANYYKNANKYNVEVPVSTNGSLNLKPGEYVKGTYFAHVAANGTLTDVGAGVPAAVTANASLLVFTQDENAGVAVGSSVQTAEIDDLGVATGKIADLAVTTGKLANLGVTTGKIADLAVTTGKMALVSVTNAQLALDAVTETKILNGSVTPNKVDLFGTPTAADDSGFQGNLRYDGTYLYLCTADDTWVRMAIVPVAWA